MAVSDVEAGFHGGPDAQAWEELLDQIAAALETSRKRRKTY